MAEPWLSIAEFGYDRIDDTGAILRLMAAVDSERELPSDASLVVERHRRLTKRLESVRWIRPSGAEWSEHRQSGCVLWQVTFNLPLEVVRSPRSLFTLTASNRLALALPAPQLRVDLLPAAVELRPRRRAAVARVRRTAVAFTAGLAAAAAVGSAGGAALAGTIGTTSPGNGAAVTTTDTTSTPTDTTTTPPPPTTPTDTTTTPAPPPPPTTPTDTTATPPPPPPPATPTTTAPTTSTPAPADPATSPAPATSTAPAASPPAQAGPPTHASTTTSARTGGHHKPSRRTPAHRTGHRHSTSGHHASGRHKHRLAAAKARHRTHRAAHAPAGPSLLAPVAGPAYQDPFSPAQLSLLSSLVGTTNQPPAYLIPIYKAAGRRYHIPWRILAAINAIETDYGSNLNVSSAGAEGWMQFMPSTWARYGVDVTGHGRPNPYDPRDAIFAAAHYLAAAGGAHDIRRAIFAYNHALWYVDAVLWRAETITGAAKLGRDSGYALPLDARYMHELGRTDDGLDIETAPDGAPVYSITPGVVTAVASDPAGFGPDYPVVLVTSGPLAGQSIYYGHVAASLVKVGQHVIAGEPIAVIGHAGDAASLGHGHIEIGFSTSGGDPLNHHAGGGTAWTPSGAAMRSLVVALSRSLGIKNS
ncbi:MAG TPA: lytic murein transglycosylase [Solirubrobacteraceae bacterium]|nr:lytic murein transglycosylase [Solirubrobacteraceae bacterium]